MPINPVALELFFHCISRSHGLAVASVVEVVVVENPLPINELAGKVCTTAGGE